MIDNSTHIINALEKKISQDVKELKDEHKKQISELKKAHKKRLKELEVQLDTKQEIVISAKKKQRENMIAMKQNHLELQQKQEIYKQLINTVKKELLKPTNVSKLLTLIEAKTLHVPKGVKVAGAKADLEINKLIGVESEDVEYEFDIDAALAQEQILMETVEELI